MEAATVLLLAVGLAMDAFAVSVCKGLSMGKTKAFPALVIGAWFGFFQFVMPVIGYHLGSSFLGAIEDYDHWVAFGLLALIGTNMVREGLSGGEERMDADTGPKVMFVLAVATSIDALAVGISMAVDPGSIWVPSVAIGAVTMALSVAGVWIGGLFGAGSGPKAEVAGGVILVLIGFKVLLEHLGYI